uniref:Uncharacterized protein n=1 Tax=Plectus sambesii TaxID=2011161 RepID=A0A914WNZ0_9BILA
ALLMVKSAWNLVTLQTTSNCFCKVGFTSQRDRNDLQECEDTDDNQAKPNAEDLGDSAEQFTELVNCDQKLECYGELTDLEIAANIQGSNKNDSNDESREVEEIER